MILQFSRPVCALWLRRFSIAALMCQSAVAATFYIAPNGNDGSSGSSDAPFATLQKGVNVARAGDTILVRNGTYGHVNAVTGGDGANYAATPVILYYSGTSSAWITIKAENKWGAVLDCELICDSYFDLRNASYISIEGFVITRGFKEGIHSNDAAHHIALRGNRIEYIANRDTTTQIGLSGMYTNPNCHDFIIDGNVFHNIGRNNALSYDHGLYLKGSNYSITNNIFYNNQRGWAIQLANGASNVTITNNTFAFPNPNKEGHIMLWDSQSGLTIQNNIFYSPQGNAITRYASSVSACSVNRNIVYGANGMMSDTSGCSLSNNQVGADPMFVSPSTFDFHVRTGGPGVDSGMNTSVALKDFDGVNRPQGGSTDIGAYESNTATGPVISAVSVSSVLSISATVTWTTDKPSTTYVEYGLGGFVSATPENPTMTTLHSVVLLNLSPSSLYQFRVGSRDAGGLLTVSPGYSFATAAVAPQFSLTPAQPSVSVVKGSAGSVLINASSVAGSPGTAGFTTSSLPAGVTASFSSPSCAPSCSSTLAFAVGSGAASGTFPITVTANAAAVSASASVSLTVTNPTALAADATSGLAGLWEFSEGNSNRTADSSGNGNTATLQRVSWSRSWCGSCVWLRGDSSTLTVQDSPSLQLTSRMTVSAWLVPGNSTSGDPRIVSKLYDWDLKLNGANRYPQFSVGSSYAMLNQPTYPGIWQHVVFTFSSGVVKGYINGQPASFLQNTFNGTETLPTYQYGLFFGSADGSSSYYGGFLDDIRIYNRDLSAADVALLYTQTRH